MFSDPVHLILLVIGVDPSPKWGYKVLIGTVSAGGGSLLVNATQPAAIRA